MQENESTFEEVTLEGSLIDNQAETPVVNQAPGQGLEGSVENPEPVVEQSDQGVREIGESQAEPEVVIEKVEEEFSQPQQKSQSNSDLPEGIDKLVEFINQGGTVEQYVNLNKDVDSMKPEEVIREYYRQKNPHMKEERLTRKMNKNFKFDEDSDEEDVIQDKKDLFEDELFTAKQHLKSNKEQFYSELKQRQAGASVEDQNKRELMNSDFKEKTDQVFGDNFKGFVFDFGSQGGKVRYKIDDSSAVKADQSDLTNFLGEYLGEDGLVTDPERYHKALWAAKNHDKIASLAYQQGRADAVTETEKDSKNISMDPSGLQSSAGVKQATPGSFEEVDYTPPKRFR